MSGLWCVVCIHMCILIAILGACRPGQAERVSCPPHEKFQYAGTSSIYLTCDGKLLKLFPMLERLDIKVDMEVVNFKYPK